MESVKALYSSGATQEDVYKIDIDSYSSGLGKKYPLYALQK
jgi:hypothetical protein